MLAIGSVQAQTSRSVLRFCGNDASALARTFCKDDILARLRRGRKPGETHEIAVRKDAPDEDDLPLPEFALGNYREPFQLDRKSVV